MKTLNQTLAQAAQLCSAACSHQPIRGEDGGHVTSAPPTTAHLGHEVQVPALARLLHRDHQLAQVRAVVGVDAAQLLGVPHPAPIRGELVVT